MDYKYYVPLFDWEMGVLTNLLEQVSESLKSPDATINSEERTNNILLFEQLLVRFYTVKEYYDENGSQLVNLEDSALQSEDG